MARWLCCLYEVSGRFFFFFLLSLRGGGQVGILCTAKGKIFFYLVGVGFFACYGLCVFSLFVQCCILVRLVVFDCLVLSICLVYLGITE